MTALPTHVVILAQGQQSRLPELDGFPKQWLPLRRECPMINVEVPILVRTLWQCRRVLRWRLADPAVPVVVCAGRLQAELVNLCLHRDLVATTFALPDPGNSSLKGVHRYFSPPRPVIVSPRERYVVLLGDVVYSWACLRALLDSPHPVSFVGTSDLSQSSGELWGVTWETEHHSIMMALLETALAKHPPFDEYQPGQLRQWLFAAGAALRGQSLLTTIDDYTRDIDIPEHLALLPELARFAAADDAQNGMPW